MANAPVHSAKKKPGRKSLCGAGCVTGASAATNSGVNIRKEFTISISFAKRRVSPSSSMVQATVNPAFSPRRRRTIRRHFFAKENFLALRCDCTANYCHAGIAPHSFVLCLRRKQRRRTQTTLYHRRARRAHALPAARRAHRLSRCRARRYFDRPCSTKSWSGPAQCRRGSSHFAPN